MLSYLIEMKQKIKIDSFTKDWTREVVVCN